MCTRVDAGPGSGYYPVWATGVGAGTGMGAQQVRCGCGCRRCGRADAGVCVWSLRDTDNDDVTTPYLMQYTDPDDDEVTADWWSLYNVERWKFKEPFTCHPASAKRSESPIR